MRSFFKIYDTLQKGELGIPVEEIKYITEFVDDCVFIEIKGFGDSVIPKESIKDVLKLIEDAQQGGASRHFIKLGLYDLDRKRSIKEDPDRVASYYVPVENISYVWKEKTEKDTGVYFYSNDNEEESYINTRLSVEEVIELIRKSQKEG